MKENLITLAVVALYMATCYHARGYFAGGLELVIAVGMSAFWLLTKEVRSEKKSLSRACGSRKATN